MSNPTIIFDLDGTLADTSRDLVAVLNRTIADHGIAPLTTDQIGHYAGLGGRAMLARAFEISELAISEPLLNKLSDIYLEDYSVNLAVETILFSGAFEALVHYSESGWNIGICSNKQESLIGKFIQEFKIDGFFDAYCGSDTFENRKPHPEHLIKTVLQAGGSPHNAIMVGDARPDFLAANAANIPVVAVDFGYSDVPVSTFNPDKIISHFDALPAAVSQIRDSGKFGVAELSQA